MRMWMINPKFMCRKHLLGEHVEIHMFLGAMKKGYSMGGYVQNNLLEAKSLFKRHEQLKQEMIERGYNHKSELEESTVNTITQKIPDEFLEYEVDVDSSSKDLFNRCEECKKRKGEF